MKLIFVSGKYRSANEWELEQNIRVAEDAAVQLWKNGWAVFCPHKNALTLAGLAMIVYG